MIVWDAAAAIYLFSEVQFFSSERTMNINLISNVARDDAARMDDSYLSHDCSPRSGIVCRHRIP
jgi:hypothetical protein